MGFLSKVKGLWHDNLKLHFTRSLSGSPFTCSTQPQKFSETFSTKVGMKFHSWHLWGIGLRHAFWSQTKLFKSRRPTIEDVFLPTKSLAWAKCSQIFFCLAGCGLVGPNASGWYQRESGLGPGEGPQIPPGDGVRSESQRIRKSEWQIPSERSCIQEESAVFTWYSRVRVRFIETWGFQRFKKNVCR